MRASIIIAAHQDGALLGKTIESCLRNCSDLQREIIVADDGSVDDLQSRYPEVIVVRHEPRHGVSATKDLGSCRCHDCRGRLRVDRDVRGRRERAQADK